MLGSTKRGFTLLEIIGVTVIIAILTAAGGFAATQSVHRSKIDGTAADLQVFAADMQAVLEDIGVVQLATTDSGAIKKAKINEYLSILEEDYTHLTFDRNTLQIGTSRFTIQTYEAVDSWGSKFTLIYNTDSAKGEPGTCILASPGPNLMLESTGYASGVFNDDILVIVTPK